MAKKLENMTKKELDKAHQEAMEQEAAWRETCREVQAERDRRALETKVGNLSGAEKDALVQMIEAEGIPSEEAVGEPGGK